MKVKNKVKVRKWISNISEIREAVKKAKFPKEFKLSESETITDVKKFIESHLKYIDRKKLLKPQRPYYDRLKKVLDTKGIEIKVEQIEEF